MSLFLITFNGGDSTHGPIIIDGLNVAAGDQVLSVVDITGTLGNVGNFARFAPSGGMIVQTAGPNWSANRFVALIERQ